MCGECGKCGDGCRVMAVVMSDVIGQEMGGKERGEGEVANVRDRGR